jgi:hypothetical protein
VVPYMILPTKNFSSASTWLMFLHYFHPCNDDVNSPEAALHLLPPLWVDVAGVAWVRSGPLSTPISMEVTQLDARIGVSNWV